MHLTRPQQPQQLPEALRRAGFLLVLFLCLFIPFRTPLSDLTVSAVKAVPDVLILCLAAWYAVTVRFRFRFTLHDVVFLAFLAVGLVSTAVVNGNGVGLFVYQTRSIGIYYILYFIIRNFGFGQRELIRMTRVLQLVSVPLFLLAMVEKVFSKTFLFNTDFASGLDKVNFGRLYSMFYNPNTYGLFLVFVILLSLVIWYLADEKTPLWLYCTLAISLYMTMSRSSMMILAAVLLFLLVLVWRGKKVEIRWKKLILWCACMGVCALAVTYATGYAAQIYFEKYGKYAVVENLSNTHANAISRVTYITSSGEECVGYGFGGVTYTDIECTTPLNDYGAVVSVGDNRYILTNQGGRLVEEFLALPPAEQSALLDGSVVRDGEVRQNSVIQNIQNSFDVTASDRFGELDDDKLYTAANNGRLFALQLALRVWGDHPVVGTGFGTFGSSASLTWVPDIYYDYDMLEGFYADNQFACVLVETGTVGFLLFLAFLLCTLWYHRGNLLKVITCVIIAWFGVFYNILEIQMGAMLLWTILSLDLGRITPRDLLNK
ncbi:MAG: O-antigen ligase family protein [Clostridia bacterium]|nr:O-antigen ligase family protein [Clostridia bacterium]